MSQQVTNSPPQESFVDLSRLPPSTPSPTQVKVAYVFASFLLIAALGLGGTSLYFGLNGGLTSITFFTAGGAATTLVGSIALFVIGKKKIESSNISKETLKAPKSDQKNETTPSVNKHKDNSKLSISDNTVTSVLKSDRTHAQSQSKEQTKPTLFTPKEFYETHVDQTKDYSEDFNNLSDDQLLQLTRYTLNGSDNYNFSHNLFKYSLDRILNIPSKRDDNQFSFTMTSKLIVATRDHSDDNIIKIKNKELSIKIMKSRISERDEEIKKTEADKLKEKKEKQKIIDNDIYQLNLDLLKCNHEDEFNFINNNNANELNKENFNSLNTHQLLTILEHLNEVSKCNHLHLLEKFIDHLLTTSLNRLCRLKKLKFELNPQLVDYLKTRIKKLNLNMDEIVDDNYKTRILWTKISAKS